MSSLFDSGIIPAINDHIKAESEKIRDYGDYWSASSAGYCMRLVIMRRLGVPPVPEIDKASTQRVFSAGHIFHDWIQNITKQTGLSIASEVELQDEDLMVRGHFDDLILVASPIHTDRDPLATIEAADWPPKHLILYDYKTAHSKWFEYVKGRPMSYHNKMQLGTYMYMLRQAPSGVLPSGKYNAMHSSWLKNLTEARILKISKDDLRLHEQQLLWSDELEKEVLEYWEELGKFWIATQATGILPPCTCLDQENGFMGKRSSKGKVYNDYFYQDEPCSQAWLNKWKAEAK